MKNLDQQIRARMARTGESYEDAAKTIGDYNVERVRVVVALRVWARSYASAERAADGSDGGLSNSEVIEQLASRIERGEHETLA